MAQTISLTQNQLDILKSSRVHICTPCYGGQLTEPFFMSMMGLSNFMNQNGLVYTLETIVNESLITRARNSLVAKMMQRGTEQGQEKSTHLVFIDADIEFKIVDFIKLIVADKDVVGGMYPKKCLPIDYVLNTLPESKQENTLIEVKRLGTGFFCVKRHVIEKMFEAYPELKYTDSIGLDVKFDPFKYSLFDVAIDPENKVYLSEDYVFCDRWRKLGGEVWTDISITLNHVGHYNFKGEDLVEKFTKKAEVKD